MVVRVARRTAEQQRQGRGAVLTTGLARGSSYRQLHENESFSFFFVLNKRQSTAAVVIVVVVVVVTVVVNGLWNFRQL